MNHADELARKTMGKTLSLLDEFKAHQASGLLSNARIKRAPLSRRFRLGTFESQGFIFATFLAIATVIARRGHRRFRRSV